MQLLAKAYNNFTDPIELTSEEGKNETDSSLLQKLATVETQMSANHRGFQFTQVHITRIYNREDIETIREQKSRDESSCYEPGCNEPAIYGFRGEDGQIHYHCKTHMMKHEPTHNSERPINLVNIEFEPGHQEDVESVLNASNIRFNADSDEPGYVRVPDTIADKVIANLVAAGIEAERQG